MINTTTSGSTQRRARRSHTKSKNGCRTCRIRKVKCDERRPLCQNCERHFIGLTDCDFDEYIPSRSRPDATVVANSQPANEGESSAVGHRPPSVQGSTAPLSHLRGRLAEPLDPFISLNQQILSPFVNTLMRHYLGSFIYRTFPFYARPYLAVSWWHFLREDELSFHVTLLLSCFDCLRLAKLSRVTYMTNPDPASSLSNMLFYELMQRCLFLLASRVGDPLANTSDNTISAVAGIAGLEHGRQNTKELRTHRQGLKQLVNARGGLSTFQAQNPLVANIAFWTIMVTSERHSQTSTSRLPNSREVLLEQYQLLRPAVQTSAEAIHEMRDAGIDEVTITVVDAVQLLSEIMPRQNPNPEVHHELRMLSAICTVVADLLDLGRRVEIGSQVSALSRSIRLAACLQVFAPVSAYFPDPTLLLHAIVHDLKASLSAVIENMDSAAQILLWLLAVGGVSAHDMVERSWYVGHLVSANSNLGIHDFNTFRRQIELFAPNDGFCTVSFSTLWEEINQKGLDFMSVTS